MEAWIEDLTIFLSSQCRATTRLCIEKSKLVLVPGSEEAGVAKDWCIQLVFVNFIIVNCLYSFKCIYRGEIWILKVKLFVC